MITIKGPIDIRRSREYMLGYACAVAGRSLPHVLSDEANMGWGDGLADAIEHKDDPDWIAPFQLNCGAWAVLDKPGLLVGCFPAYILSADYPKRTVYFVVDSPYDPLATMVYMWNAKTFPRSWEIIF